MLEVRRIGSTLPRLSKTSATPIGPYLDLTRTSCLFPVPCQSSFLRAGVSIFAFSPTASDRVPVVERPFIPLLPMRELRRQTLRCPRWQIGCWSLSDLKYPLGICAMCRASVGGRRKCGSLGRARLSVVR